jgi:hypothetical protein
VVVGVTPKQGREAPAMGALWDLQAHGLKHSGIQVDGRGEGREPIAVAGTARVPREQRCPRQHVVERGLEGLSQKSVLMPYGLLILLALLLISRRSKRKRNP